jgi:hypothetical protein
MRSVSRWAILAVILGVAAGSSLVPLRADDVPTTGTLSGKVVDKDGNPVAGARVAAVKADDLRPGRKAAPKPPADGSAADAPATNRPTPVATAETDQDGAFTLKDLPVGKYAVLANLRGAGRGRAKGPLEVTAGQNTDAGILTLAASNAKNGKKGGGAPTTAPDAGNN